MELDINGQEILTADKVSLRVNFVTSYRITDAVKITGEVKNYKELEYLEKICDKVGSISFGGGNLLSELQKIISTSRG